MTVTVRETRTTDSIRVPVLIIGAGPAGLVTGIGLARNGARSMLIERHPSTSIFPRATGVSTRSMEIFRGWGIDEAVRRGGWNVIPRMAIASRFDDRAPAEGPLGFPDEAESAAVSPTTAAVSPQDHLEPVLLEHYESIGGDTRFSTELVGFEQDADGVRATIRDRSTGELSYVRCDYLVGADGHRSTVRSTLGIPMEGPDNLGQYFSILFRADLSDVLGERRYGLYTLAGDGPPTVLVPSGTDDRFVFAIPLPPGMDEAAVAARFPLDRCEALVREACGRPDLDIEILATSAFAFSAQVATQWHVGRAFLVGDAAHRMTPRGGRGMNTAIADAFDLSWKLAWVQRGIADPSLLDTYEAERGPIGRRNVAMSMAPGGGGSDDGLAEDLGWVVGSPEIAFPPDGRPGSRAAHAWVRVDGRRRSTLDLFGGGLVLLTAGSGEAWQSAASCVSETSPGMPLLVRSFGKRIDRDRSFATAYGLQPGGAVLVR
ncbi:MAG: FAD-dependent monooxygenase, partial [Chloroflexota bacterium]